MSESNNPEVLPYTLFERPTKINSNSPYYLRNAFFPPDNKYIKPPILVWGTARPFVDEFSLVIAGSRSVSEEGRETCRYFASNLAKEGVVINSGLAEGVDEEAHRSVLEVGGRTVAFLPSGTDEEVIFPQKNKGLAKQIAESDGMVISQFDHNFRKTDTSPLDRNEFMVMCSLGILIPWGEWHIWNGKKQIGQRSGTLSAVNRAERYSIKAFAVPGSEVTDFLIGTGKAYPVLDYIDVLRSLIEIKNQRKVYNQKT